MYRFPKKSKKVSKTYRSNGQREVSRRLYQIKWGRLKEENGLVV